MFEGGKKMDGASLARSAGWNLIAPIVFTPNFFLFLRGKIILDFKAITNGLGRGAFFDIFCNRLARQVQQVLNVQEIGGEDDVEQHLILYSNKLTIISLLLIIRS
jgi:hypothetical protein